MLAARDRNGDDAPVFPAPQDGNDLVDDPIALRVCQPAELLAEHVDRQPHHPVTARVTVRHAGCGGHP